VKQQQVGSNRRNLLPGPPSNAQIAELLAAEADKASDFLAKALRKASRLAWMWPEEAEALHAQGRSLTEFPGIGPHLEKVLTAWIENPPPLSDEIPEIRKNFWTLAEARRILSRKPRWPTLYKGDLQMHSVWSDGSGSIAEMAEAGIARGYEYIGITDHSKGLKIAGGIDERALARQAAEIAGVNRRLTSAGRSFRVLHGIELNLNPEGKEDMDPAALRKLDFVVGSFHSALRKKEDQTERYLAALKNPVVDILGHPRGRIYNYRLGLSADWPQVFACAAEMDKAVEIDSYADRQDLDRDLLKLARRGGVRIAIDTDAHHPHQLEFVTLGLASAIDAKIPAERIINFLPAEQLLRWVEARRVRSVMAWDERR